MLCVLYVAFNAMLLLLVPLLLLLLLWCAVSVEKKRRVWQRAQRNRKRMSATTQKRTLCVKTKRFTSWNFNFMFLFDNFIWLLFRSLTLSPFALWMFCYVARQYWLQISTEKSESGLQKNSRRQKRSMHYIEDESKHVFRLDIGIIASKAMKNGMKRKSRR